MQTLISATENLNTPDHLIGREKTFAKLLRHRCRVTSGLRLGVVILVCSLAPGLAKAQTNSVQIQFSDQTKLSDPFADPVIALTGGTAQESDFAPKPRPVPNDDSKVDPNFPPRPDSKTDQAIEFLQLDGERDAPEKNDPTKRLGSDDPVDPPSFNLTDEDTDAPQSNERKSQSKGPVQQSLSDGYRLPEVADVRTPISYSPLSNTRQNDPSGLLLNDQTLSNQQRYVAPNSTYAETSGMPAAAKFKTWRSHDVYHRPTYFEDQNLELNGNQRPFQNAASAVSFFSTIPRIPYLIGEHHPRERIYTYGEDRPGDAAPFRSKQAPSSRKGKVLQTIATLGIILP